MHLQTHLRIARKTQAAAALLRSAEHDLVAEFGDRKPIDLTDLRFILTGLESYSLEKRLLTEYPDRPLLQSVWADGKLGAVAFVLGRDGQRVAMDTVDPSDPEPGPATVVEQMAETTPESEITYRNTQSDARFQIPKIGNRR